MKLSIVRVLLSSATLVFTTAAYCQTAPADKATPPSGAQTASQAVNAEGTDIVVTARSRAETLQKVPDSVTAVSGALIDKAGVQNVADLTRMVPNFDFRTGFRAGAAQITVRGLTTPQGGDLPIALVVDGVQLPGADFFNQDLLDIAQVEVLRGPQGALYGQGALAGAMLITTRKPTNDFEFNGKASYGTGDTYHLVGSVSGPIVKDALYFRVVGAYRNSDGTIRDVNGHGVNFVDEPFVRAELRYDNGGSFRATLAGNYDSARNGAIYQDFVSTLPNGTFDIDSDTSNIRSNIIGYDERKIYGGSLRLEQDLGGGVLSSTTAYNRLTDFTFGDADWSPADIVAQANVYNVRLFSEDFRYTSSSDHPFRYVFGAFYQSRVIDEGLDVPFRPGSGLTGSAVATSDRQRSRSWALFGQVNYNITDKFEITAALRYDANNRTFHNIFTNAKLEQDFNKLQPKVSLAYNWSDNFMTYATFAIGYRSGGFNAASSVFAGPIIDGETSQNYEVGFKARLPDGLGSIAGSAFRIDLKKGQFFFISTTPPSQNTINIDSSHINGAELEVQLRPLNHLELQGSIGISDAVIDDFNGTGLNDHSPFPNVPAYTARGSASYDIDMGGNYTLTPRVDVFNRGRVYYFPARRLRSAPYTNVDLRLTLATPTWSLAGYVSNLTNERHGEQPADIGLRIISEPRTFGAELSVHFK